MCIQVFVIQAPLPTFRLAYVVIAIFLSSFFFPLPLSKAFLFHFFNIFLSPCPFIFINSPRAVESANLKNEIAIPNFLVEE